MAKQIVAAAPGGSGIDWNEFTGKLVVIEPLEVEKDIRTVHGVSDAVRANVWVLTGKDTQEAFEDTLIFPKVLQSQTKKKIGEVVVGRLGQGEAKRGQNAPWILAEPTPGDIKKAAAFWATQAVTGGASGADEDDEYDEYDEYDDNEKPF